MKLAIVGSRALEGSFTAQLLVEAIIKTHRPSEIISGGAIGIDAIAARAAHRAGIKLTEFLPKHPRWEPEGFKQRNGFIADACDRLACLTIYPKGKTEGALWTMRFAESLHKPVEHWEITHEGVAVTTPPDTHYVLAVLQNVEPMTGGRANAAP